MAICVRLVSVEGQEYAVENFLLEKSPFLAELLNPESTFAPLDPNEPIIIETTRIGWETAMAYLRWLHFEPHRSIVRWFTEKYTDLQLAFGVETLGYLLLNGEASDLLYYIDLSGMSIEELEYFAGVPLMEGMAARTAFTLFTLKGLLGSTSDGELLYPNLYSQIVEFDSVKKFLQWREARDRGLLNVMLKHLVSGRDRPSTHATGQPFQNIDYLLMDRYGLDPIDFYSRQRAKSEEEKRDFELRHFVSGLAQEEDLLYEVIETSKLPSEDRYNDLFNSANNHGMVLPYLNNASRRNLFSISRSPQCREELLVSLRWYPDLIRPDVLANFGLWHLFPQQVKLFNPPKETQQIQPMIEFPPVNRFYLDPLEAKGLAVLDGLRSSFDARKHLIQGLRETGFPRLIEIADRLFETMGAFSSLPRIGGASSESKDVGVPYKPVITISSYQY